MKLTTILLLSILANTQSPAAIELLEQANFQGGVILHVRSGDSIETAKLYQQDNSLVYGLERDAAKIGDARNHAYSSGVAGKVSIDHWSTEHLPFSENFINLLVREEKSLVSDQECLRVLAPKGVMLTKSENGWVKQTKERPTTIDDWPQHFYSAGGNPHDLTPTSCG